MLSNTPCTPFLDDSDEPYFVGQESWEAFVKLETENLCSQAAPAPGVSPMVFEQPIEYPERMVVEQENDCTLYSQQYFRNSVDESKLRRSGSYRLHMAYNNDLSETTQGSDCLGQKSEQEEEATSVSTRDSRFGEFNNFENDRLSSATDGDFFEEGVCDIDTELTKTVIKVLQGRPDEEKAYIEQIFPMLLNSVKEALVQSQLPMTEQIVAAIVKDLLQSKMDMMAEERDVFDCLTQDEMEDVMYERPDEKITEEELAISNRKEKRAVKGNRNGSSMNHFNENYVSNVFQFAKRNYPEDKELQRIGSARNVSALNFRRIVGTKLTDGIMARRAKARIAESGRELIGNVEYWMRDGYFEQCADREKYIYHKDKALRDLALTGNY
jgi:hypothetical protein